MKKALLMIMTFFILNSWGNAQLLQMAANCDQASTKIAEIIKSSDATTAERIRDLFGVDIFDSCNSAGGKTICFQCIDNNQKLRLIQLREDLKTGKYEFKGFGCLCNEKK